MSCFRICSRMYSNAVRNNWTRSLPMHMAKVPRGVVLHCCKRTAIQQYSPCLARYLHSTKLPGAVLRDGKMTPSSNTTSSKRIQHEVHAGDRLRMEMKAVYTSTELLDVYRKYKGDVSGSDYVKVLVRLAKFRRDGRFQKSNTRESQILEELLEDIQSTAVDLKPFEMADIFWCLGKLEFDHGLLSYLSALLETKDISQLSNTDLAMIFWGHGKLGKVSPVLLNHMKKEILSRGVENFKTRELCQIVWSVARTLKTSAKLLAAIREEVQKQDLSKFNKQDLLMLMWAYSEAGVNVKPLFRHFKSEILKTNRFAEFSARDLSQIVWAFANQRIKAPDLFSKAERELLIRSEVQFDAQSLVVVAWSFAYTDNSTPRLFSYLERKLKVENLNSWSLHRLTRLTWSFVKSGYLTQQLLNRLSSAMLCRDFSEFTSSSLEEIVFVMQECSLKIPPVLVNALETELVKRANKEH